MPIILLISVSNLQTMRKNLWSARVYCFHFPELHFKGWSCLCYHAVLYFCEDEVLFPFCSPQFLNTMLCNWSCNLLYIAHSCHVAWSVELTCWKISDIGYRLVKWSRLFAYRFCVYIICETYCYLILTVCHWPFLFGLLFNYRCLLLTMASIFFLVVKVSNILLFVIVWQLFLMNLL